MASHGVAVESTATRHKAVRRRYTDEFICSSRRVKGEAREAVGVVSSSPAVRIFTKLCLSDGHNARITASGDQRRWTTGDEQRDRIFFSLPFTVPWDIQFMTPDRASLSHFFSDFQMATHPVTYSKVVELYTIYNSTIGTELI
jgi:hypothetical protein